MQLKFLQPDEAVKYIISQYGTNIFSDSKRFSALLMDLIIEKVKERNILKIAINAGIPSKLLSAESLDNTDKNLISSECKLILCENYGIEQEWAIFAVNCFTSALGWEKRVINPDEMIADAIRKIYNS